MKLIIHRLFGELRGKRKEEAEKSSNVKRQEEGALISKYSLSIVKQRKSDLYTV